MRVPWICLLLTTACATEPTTSIESASTIGDLSQEGAFTCDLVIGPELSPPQAPIDIERDRILMSHPGMRQKMLPIAFGPNNTLFMGGRYLFDTEDQAKDYADFVLHRYVLDGVQFVNRVYFHSHDCRAWQTIGAHDFADFRSDQVVVRTERWQVPGQSQEHGLRTAWPQLRDAAAARGLTSVWLLYSQADNLVQLVYYADRVDPPDPNVPDFASLGALAGQPPLGATLAGTPGWTQDLDESHWIFTIWQPYVAGDRGAPSIHPYSPPFPGLSCGDGLCVPSRGENAATCPADCPTNCGDDVCQPDQGEDVHNCPSDCRVPTSTIQ
jgi:hypothetical protein